MPWLTIIMMLVSYFSQKRDTPEQRTKAALGAAVVGGATYYATHETDWGRENLGAFDGVAQPTIGADGQPSAAAAKLAALPTSSATNPPVGSGGWDVLKSWGPGGTAAVVGGTIAASSINWGKLMPWLIGAGGLYLITR